MAAQDDKLMNLFREVAANDMRLGPLMYQINLMVNREAILKWLWENNLTGDKLVQWMKFENGNSMLKTIKEVVRRIDKESEVRAIVVGKDYVPNR